MRISGTGSTRTTTAKRTDKSKRSGDSTFASHLHDNASPAVDGEMHGIDTPSPMSGLESLLSMQSVDADGQGRGRANQKAMQRGEDVLDRLEDLRHGLLMGHVPKSQLADLASLVRSRRDAGADPHLAAILDEIELRAEVELAKLARR